MIPQPPAEEIEVPERIKPTGAMDECPDFPWLDLEALRTNPSEAAKILVSSYVAGLEAYELCETKRQALIDWINNDTL